MKYKNVITPLTDEAVRGVEYDEEERSARREMLPVSGVFPDNSFGYRQ